MRGFKEPSPKLNNALYFLAGMLTVVFIFIIVVGFQSKAGGTGYNYDYAYTQPEQGGRGETVSDNVFENVTSNQPVTQEKWQEGVVSYKGKNYRYNSNIRSYLIMGVDKDEPVTETTDMTNGGQSDAMFLLVVDSKNERLSVVSIHRNTMTTISLCDENGYSLGDMQAQICLQHAFGDGKKLSCNRTVDVVSKLFGNIPINGYLAMNMGGIPMMNDSIGGVKLEILYDISFPDKGVDLKKGEVRTLRGTEAYYYLRGRDITQFNSATERLRREEQYIVGYMDKLKSLAGGNSAIVVSVYEAVADYLVTSVDFSTLIEELMPYTFSSDQMYTIPGNAVAGEKYEEFYVDEDAFQDLIYDVFYVPAE